MTDERTICVIEFSGKQVDWAGWSEKFLARAHLKGYQDVLLGDKKVPNDDESLDLSTDEGKAGKKARDRNVAAYVDLILSITNETEAGRVAFQIVKGAKPKTLKRGDAKLAWKCLCNRR